jgi:hypothetical protein
MLRACAMGCSCLGPLSIGVVVVGTVTSYGVLQLVASVGFLSVPRAGIVGKHGSGWRGQVRLLSSSECAIRWQVPLNCFAPRSRTAYPSLTPH